MKVIIAGSRTIKDYEKVFAAVNASGFDITEVVSGGAKGVDSLGEEFAEEQRLGILKFIPDWDGLGKRAGFARNAEMAVYADALVAVWDGQSKGTKHMITCMEGLNKPVFVYTV